jgi:hypothetical protein
MSRVLLRRDADALKYALEKLISVAEQCDSCETFPSKALDEAYAAIDAYLDKPLPEPVSYQFQDDGKWHDFINEEHYKNTVKDGRWPIRALYAEPPARNCSEWISVEDKLPKSNKPVLVHYKTLMANSVISVGLNFDGHGIFRQLVGGLEIQEVTHWMPLPERPELKTAHGITDPEQSKPQSNAI